MAQRGLSCLILFPLFFFTCPILSSSSSLWTSEVNSPSTQAERLIRSFNLFPSSGINSGSPSSRRLPDALSSSLVEKRFRLPALGHPGIPIQNLGHHAGYYRLPHSNDARMFYYFFESRKGKRNDPVVIWLSGGPGASSSLALFYENGPYKISSRNNSLVWNDYGWDQVSNLIYVDQPTGTGFSYSSDESDIRNNQEDVSNDLYDFLQAFFEEHPQYLNNDFYITGQSYAGHYIPALATRIQNGNKNRDGAHINLKGFAIGNGLTDPAIQHRTLPEYAFRVSLITKSHAADIIAILVPICETNVAECNARIGGEGESCIDAYYSCTAISDHLKGLLGSKNIYDIRKTCVGDKCYDFSYMERLLNEPSVKNSLGVGEDIKFESKNDIVYNALRKDIMRNHAVKIPSLLKDGIKVLIYAGEYDLLCNWHGNYMWVKNMEWSGKRKFNRASTVIYQVDGAEKGELTEYGPLSFLKVFDAGHLVPMDQPKAALAMLERWIQGTLSMSREQVNRKRHNWRCWKHGYKVQC